MTCVVKYVLAPIAKYTQGWINRGLYRLYDGKGIYNSDVIVVFVAKHDWNGAYSYPSPVHIFRTLNNDGPAFVFKRVSSIEQMNAFIFEQKSLGNRICGIWIKAHGDIKSIHIGKGYHHETTYHTYSNIDFKETDATLLIPALNQLEPHAAIVLESCRTGARTLNGCFAQRISELCPNHSVFACESSLMAIGVDCKVSNRTLKATFIDFRTSHKGIKGFFINSASFAIMILSFGYIGENRTIIYRS